MACVDMAYIVMAYVLMAYVVMVYSYGRYRYGLYSYGCNPGMAGLSEHNAEMMQLVKVWAHAPVHVHVCR